MVKGKEDSGNEIEAEVNHFVDTRYVKALAFGLSIMGNDAMVHTSNKIVQLVLQQRDVCCKIRLLQDKLKVVVALLTCITTLGWFSATSRDKLNDFVARITVPQRGV